MSAPRGHAIAGNRWDLLDGHDPSPPSVSVVVAHYEQPEQLARTLAALARQDHPRDRLEVIVADDGSAQAPSVPSDVTLVRQEDRGFRLAAARNLGAARATGDVLVFLDADTTPERSFVRELTRLPALAPDCVAVGRRRHADLAGTDPSRDILDTVSGRELPEPDWLREAYCSSRDLLDADDRSYRYVIGAVLACSRRLFDETGGFDETFDAYGGEDWEWAYRAWIAGAVFAHVPAAVAWHDGPDVTGRDATSLAAKNAEVMRLSRVVPVPGSRAKALPGGKVDIAVLGPPASASPAQTFIAQDSVLAELRGAEAMPASGAGSGFDRVRVFVELLEPIRARGAVAAAVETVVRDQLSELLLTDRAGVGIVRVTSARARARSLRWGRDDLFPRRRAVAHDIVVLRDEPDVEAYLGGWG